MHPELLRFTIFGHLVRIPTYGVLAATGLVLAVLVAHRHGTKQGISSEGLLELGFWLVVAAILGSRAAYVLVNPGEFAGHPLRVFAIWEGGLVFYGGVAAALAAGALVVRLRSMPGWRTADVVAPGLALAHAVGRLGCFSAGCCFGKPTGTAHGLRFGPDAIAYQELARTGHISVTAHHTPGLFPVQLYESVGEASIFFVLLWLTMRKRFDGAVITAYLALYGLLRFATELYRGDPTRGYVVRLHTPALNRLLGLPEQALALLSTSQAVSILLVPAALLAHVFLARWSKRRSHG